MSIEHSRTKKKGKIALTEHQMHIVEYINANGKITIKEISNMFKISRQAALKEIGKLVELDVVRREGQAKAGYYVMI